MSSTLVSVHGGHSGQFCSHAQNTLEEVIQAYIAKGYAWVGITEHMPPVADAFMYDEERDAGFDAAALMERFHRYMTEGRRLQKKYADQLELFIAFETEAYSGAVDMARRLIDRYQPDYVLGGIHHVDDMPFDSGAEAYRRAVEACGGVETLYCRYFDLQHEMMQAIRPKVVAHFDLVRIFDDDYARRLRQPAILRRIQRNLQCMADWDLIMDYNVAALRKGADEPYVSKPILEMARDMGIAVVPGDDSHGAGMAGAYIEEGIALLSAAGINTRWRKPVE
ncbi:MAG: histidinol-phosphatase [Desulfobacteraceae bacterium]|jgi:histidinol-phosphatase (PHP family)